MKRALAALSLSLMAIIPSANAADAHLSDCIHMQKQVSSALAASPSAAKADEARLEANKARSLCATSQYTQGVAHYSKALELLSNG